MLTSMFDFEIDEAALSKQSCSSKRSMTMVEKREMPKDALQTMEVCFVKVEVAMGKTNGD